MARIRFAGRPRPRNLSEKRLAFYTEEKREETIVENLNPKFRFFSIIQRGLERFSELAGLSDEVSNANCRGLLCLTTNLYSDEITSRSYCPQFPTAEDSCSLIKMSCLLRMGLHHLCMVVSFQWQPLRACLLADTL